jgi:hypothetical protein
MQRLFYPLHRLTRAVLPQMLERKRGKMIFQAYRRPDFFTRS